MTAKILTAALAVIAASLTYTTIKAEADRLELQEAIKAMHEPCHQAAEHLQDYDAVFACSAARLTVEAYAASR